MRGHSRPRLYGRGNSASNFRIRYADALLIWRDGEDVQTWWNTMSPQLRKPPSFGLAIAGATGVSGSSACCVPKLLLPSEVGGKQGRAMTAIEGGVIDGRAFYRFQAQPQQLEKSTILEAVWIDKDTFQFSAVA